MQLVRVEKVWYEKHGRIILEDITFTIEEKTLNILLGPNGSGKTTLLKIIAGLLKPTRGDVRVLGLKPWSHRFPREEIGYVAQNPLHQLTEPTVIEELLLQATNKIEALTWAETMRLKEYLYENPLNLSYGEQKRLLIAAALARKPRILLVDELGVGQDADGLKTIIEALRKYRERGGTVIASTHDPDIAYCLKPDYSIQLVRGRLKETCRGLCPDTFY